MKSFSKFLPSATAQIVFAVALLSHTPALAETPVCDFSLANKTPQCQCSCDCPVPVTGPTRPPGGLWTCYGDDCPQLSHDQLGAIAKAVHELSLYGLIGNDNVTLTSKPGNEVIQQLRSMISKDGITLDPETQYFFAIPDSVHNYIGAKGWMLSK